MGDEKERPDQRHGAVTNNFSVAKPFATPDEFASILPHRVTRLILEETEDFLRAAGRRHAEGIVLWAGRKFGDYFSVERLVIPRQVASRWRFEVPLEERARIATGLAAGEVVAAQLHTHESAAFHSPTDDRKAIVDRRWALSIVVPYFCHEGLADLKGTAVFALRGPLDWVELTPEQINSLFVYM